MVLPSLNERARALATATAHAYSYDRYASWSAVCRETLRRVPDFADAAAWVLSKHTRWAADSSGQAYGRVTGKSFAAYLARYTDLELQRETDYLCERSIERGRTHLERSI